MILLTPAFMSTLSQASLLVDKEEYLHAPLLRSSFFWCLISLENWDFRFFNLKNLNSSRKLDSPVASAYGRSERSRAAPICHAVDNSNPRLRYVEGTELQRWNRRPL